MRMTHRRARRTAVAAFAALALVGLAACGSDASDDGAKKDGVSKIRVATFPNIDLSIEVPIGQKEGIYAKHGLDVELVPVTKGPEVVGLLQGGQADVANMSMETLLSTLETGTDFKVLSGYIQSDLELALIGDSGSVSDLKGKAIGVPALGGLPEAFARSVLTKGGLNPDKDVTFVAVGSAPTMSAAVQGNQVAGLSSSASMIAQVRAASPKASFVSLARSLDGTGGALGDVFGTMATTTPALVKSRTKDFDNYCAARAEIMDWIANPANSDKLVDYATEWMGVEKSLAGELIAPLQKLVHSSYVTADDWNNHKKLLNKPKAPEYNTVVVDGCA